MSKHANILAAFVLGLTAMAVTPAAAQAPNVNLMPELKSKTPEEKEREAQIDKAYRESLRKIPDAKTADPWGDMRGTEAAKQQPVKPKPAQPKRAKADGPAN